MRQDRLLTRRQFLLAVGGGTLAGYFGFRAIITEEQKRKDLLQGGEIIPEKDLVALYAHLCKDQVPFSIDPTVVKSTIYHSCKFYGMPEHLAHERAQSIVAPEKSVTNPICPITAAACVGYIDETGKLVTEISPAAQSGWTSTDQKWLNLCAVLSHESWHMSTEKVESQKTEDYGILGTYKLEDGIYGFHANRETYQGRVGTLTRRSVGVTVDGKVIVTSVNILEEFFAELGRIRYTEHIANLGLSQIIDFNKGYYSDGFDFMDQGLLDIQYTFPDGDSWLKWWGGVLNPNHVDTMHRSNNRHQLFMAAGERVLKINKNVEKSLTSPQNTAAIGFVAVTDFLDKTITNGEILKMIATDPLTQGALLSYAQKMSKQLKTAQIKIALP